MHGHGSPTRTPPPTCSCDIRMVSLAHWAAKTRAITSRLYLPACANLNAWLRNKCTPLCFSLQRAWWIDRSSTYCTENIEFRGGGGSRVLLSGEGEGCGRVKGVGGWRGGGGYYSRDARYMSRLR